MQIGDGRKTLGVCRETIQGLECRGVFTASRDSAGARRFTDAKVVRLRTLLIEQGAEREEVMNETAITAAT